ncbi:MAG: proton-conducting transporter membrane subunit, partial [Anaerolineae bacterium]
MLPLLLANLIAAATAPLLVARLRRGAPWILAAAPLGGAGYFLIQAFRGGLPDIQQSWVWAPQLAVDLALRADGLSYLFVALIGLVGGVVVVHAGGYMGRSEHLGRFFLLLMLFITAMFGLVLADNLWVLFLFWELTSITSYFLIGFKHGTEYAREAARRALLTTGGGGLAMLAGFALLQIMGQRAGLTGTDAASISLLTQHGPALIADPLYAPALILILLGAFTKSAQMPFHHWLPLAMAGPTPVSALLHSATMVKAGVYLLARLNPGLGGTDLWFWALVGAGTVTMVGGALLALSRTDLKDILAYTTLSALGTMVLLVGLGSTDAMAAMVVFLTVHALYKSTLFLVAANVDHRTGTRELDQLGRLGTGGMLGTAIAAMLAALGQAGAPPAMGYAGKKLALQAKLGIEGLDAWLIPAAVIANIAMVALALALAWRPFWSRRPASPLAGHPLHPGMIGGPLLLGAAGVAVGLVPRLFDTSLGSAAATAAAGE